jgi:membrane-associated phospholipid phosphatase
VVEMIDVAMQRLGQLGTLADDLNDPFRSMPFSCSLGSYPAQTGLPISLSQTTHKAGKRVSLLCPVMRELGGVAEHMNWREADAVARSTVLPPDAPVSAVTVLTEVARGGLLWVGIAATLAARPGQSRRAARDGVVAVAMASATSHLIGRWLPRRRPPAVHLAAYQALVHKPTSSSFPSAHAAAAMAFTTAIACESPAVGLMVAPVAMAVAHSRLRTRAHWPSDVVAGALWGVALGVATRRLLRLQAAADSIQVARFVAGLVLHRHLGLSMQY